MVGSENQIETLFRGNYVSSSLVFVSSFINTFFFLKNGQIDIYLPDVQVYHCENETINRKQGQEHVFNNRFHHPTDAKR